MIYVINCKRKQTTTTDVQAPKFGHVYNVSYLRLPNPPYLGQRCNSKTWEQTIKTSWAAKLIESIRSAEPTYKSTKDKKYRP